MYSIAALPNPVNDNLALPEQPSDVSELSELDSSVQKKLQQLDDMMSHMTAWKAGVEGKLAALVEFAVEVHGRLEELESWREDAEFVLQNEANVPNSSARNPSIAREGLTKFESTLRETRQNNAVVSRAVRKLQRSPMPELRPGRKEPSPPTWRKKSLAKDLSGGDIDPTDLAH